MGEKGTQELSAEVLKLCSNSQCEFGELCSIKLI